jgi:hypothetical protein
MKIDERLQSEIDGGRDPGKMKTSNGAEWRRIVRESFPLSGAEDGKEKKGRVGVIILERETSP